MDDWGERHGRKSREAAVREMGIDRIQSLKRYIGEAADDDLEATLSQLTL